MKWPTKDLAHVISLEYGASLRASDRNPSGNIPVAGSNGIDGYHSKAFVKGPGIVVGRKGSAGKITWFDTDFWPIDTTYYVKPKVRSELRWIYYLLKSLRLDRFAIVTGVPGLNRNDAYRLRFSLPPPSEQQRIVEILDQADDLRKKRTEADVKAALILPALFYKMFGDPATNPKVWPVYDLGDPQVAKINPPLIKKKISIDAEFSFVPMSDVEKKWGTIIGKQTRQYSEVCKGFTSFQDGDVIFAKITPCMQNGKAAIVSNLKNGRGFGSTEFHVLRPGPLATPEWLFGLVRLNMFRKQAEASFTGSAGQQRVPSYFLKNYKIGCPPKELQQRFASAVRLIFQHINAIETSRDELFGLFKGLIHRAFTGDLTAKWREAHMKALLVEMEQQQKDLKALPLSIN